MSGDWVRDQIMNKEIVKKYTEYLSVNHLRLIADMITNLKDEKNVSSSDLLVIIITALAADIDSIANTFLKTPICKKEFVKDILNGIEKLII